MSKTFAAGLLCAQSLANELGYDCPEPNDSYYGPKENLFDLGKDATAMKRILME